MRRYTGSVWTFMDVAFSMTHRSTGHRSASDRSEKLRRRTRPQGPRRNKTEGEVLLGQRRISGDTRFHDPESPLYGVVANESLEPARSSLVSLIEAFL